MGVCETFFVTGTDTGIGKTRSMLVLMRAFREQGFRVAGMKPVASGAEHQDGKLQNRDAQLILQECSQPEQYDTINPCVYREPVSPHLAARLEDKEVDTDRIIEQARCLQQRTDILLIEGVGGWRVPWGGQLQARDLVRQLQIPVILVVGLRLGCISHALLTAEAIRQDNIEIAGWIANRIDHDYLYADESINDLGNWLTAPLIGVLPHQPGENPEITPDGLGLQVLSRAPATRPA
ncbi:MAG: dethiobiotin synthase [Gammaproteobacteria bacterium]|nr:dethiobiotin synthase [Gammaproteobacteria bacterium]